MVVKYNTLVMNKKTIAYFALTLLMSMTAYAQQFNPESNFRIARIDNGRAVSITGYTGNSTAVNIPPQIQGLPVTAIGDRAFIRANITNVTIPNSVTSIGGSAFSDTTRLTSVTFGGNGIAIGWEAFPGNLVIVYAAGGAGAYTRDPDGTMWTRRQGQ